ncbi:CPBP family intramembrane metalloprotease [Balneolaceae bacterium YR4-1]|uniref:CPBP family intramembrane metalloprotease n=2 Tax=Halalkalibaculum roseum TaxID=2709311 RepID=A0A6M1SY33_9BACT|nr:CPBP family intramembrane metalloprotease [Halalkalibaculum roseum]
MRLLNDYKNVKMSYLGSLLHESKSAKILEICAVFLPAISIAILAHFFAGDNPLIRQSIIWIANLLMICIIWLGLRLRDHKWKDLGLASSNINVKSVLFSFVVFIAAVLGFIMGSIIMGMILGIPENADLSGYNYIQDNIPMLIIALLAVFIASSFGEEVIYRGFLITRISEIGGNRKVWVRIAVVLSSIVFGLVHFDWGLMGIVQTGFMGLALGISYIVLNRNLWVLVFAHAYMDAILMVQMYFGVSV